MEELLKKNSDIVVLDDERDLVNKHKIEIEKNMKEVLKREHGKKTKELGPFEYRAHFLKFLDRLTIHGVYDIYDVESWVLKIFMLICFLASAIYCFYQIVNSILIYLQYNVSTNSQVYISVPTEFPVVAFCNLVT